MSNKSGIEWTNEIANRFWSYVEKSDDCWIWTGGSFGGRYGQFRIGKKKIRAHRFSWLLAGNEIPDGMILCHKCDNVKCVRPDHLFVGTHADNAKDREEKGRGAGNRFARIGLKGTDNPASKINEAVVISIRRLKEKGYSLKAIAERHDLSKSQVSNILKNRNWTHVR